MALASVSKPRTSRPSRERLLRVSTTAAGASGEEHLPSFAERVARPLIMRLMNITNLAASQSMKDNLRDRLMRAGWPGNMQTQQWITFKFMMLGVLPVSLILLVFGICHMMSWKHDLMVYGICGVGGAMAGYMIPDFYINKRVKRRRKEILLALPDMIDLLTVSVEAGLGFDAAIARVSSRFKGPLGEEFQRARQEVQMGRPRAEALREMARRCEVPDLTTFVSALIQANQLGVSMGQVLRVQADQMRQRRSQRAREQAQKAPVKMMIPLVLFIFPTLFIVIMGPAAITAAKELKNAGIF